MKKKHILIISANCVCLIIFAILSIISASIANSFDSQHVVEKWSTESYSKFSYISCFFSADKKIDKYKIYSARSQIETQLMTEALIYVTDNTDAVSWTDAYSTEGEMSVDKDGRSADVNVSAVAGNYFLFHQLDMISGGYFYDDDLMKDRVIIDDYLAWQLFGSNDIIGMTMNIEGHPFIIAGIYKRPDSKYINYTYGEKSHIYMYFDTYCNMRTDASITAYEICMPNPIKSFAKDLTVKSLSLSDKDKDYTVIENSKRFSAEVMKNFVKNFNKKFIVDCNVYYPFWENSQRAAEVDVANLFKYRIIFLIPTVLTVVIYLIIGAVWCRKNTKKILNKCKNIFISIIKGGKRLFSKKNNSRIKANNVV